MCLRTAATVATRRASARCVRRIRSYGASWTDSSSCSIQKAPWSFGIRTWPATRPRRTSSGRDSSQSRPAKRILWTACSANPCWPTRDNHPINYIKKLYIMNNPLHKISFTLLLTAAAAFAGDDVATKQTLTLDGAKKAADAARSNGAPGSAIAVVDDGGHLL